MHLHKESFLKYLFIWPQWVIVGALGIFNLHCGVIALSCGMWDLVSQPEIKLRPCPGSSASYPVDHQGSPNINSFDSGSETKTVYGLV